APAPRSSHVPAAAACAILRPAMAAPHYDEGEDTLDIPCGVPVQALSAVICVVGIVVALWGAGSDDPRSSAIASLGLAIFAAGLLASLNKTHVRHVLFDNRARRVELWDHQLGVSLPYDAIEGFRKSSQWRSGSGSSQGSRVYFADAMLRDGGRIELG